MTTVVTGSIAIDHLMVFSGRFSELLIAEQLEKVSLSFLVDELRIFRGGIGANIAFGMALLGLKPVLVGAAGQDFAPYRRWLEDHGVVTDHVQQSGSRHTARFLCTTDADHNQIASFYPGAMVEAADIDLAAVLQSLGKVSLVVIGPDDPEAMTNHTRACRALGVPFAADPSQQLARLDGAAIRNLVEGATYLLTNTYERELLLRKTGWSTEEVQNRVATWVTTDGANGVTIREDGGLSVTVPAATPRTLVDPTGVGDAFRAGFLASRVRDLALTTAGQVGCQLATLVLETTGTQEYTFSRWEFLDRLRESYGEEAAASVASSFSQTTTDVA